MNKKLILISSLSFLALMSVLRIVNAATIPTATLDKETYLAGQTGSISVSVYNDKSEKIRVTELSATINYYYADRTIYVQKFFTGTTLPDEIPAGQTKTYQISLSLPTNIASGFTNLAIETKTDIWHTPDERWTTSDRPTYQLKLYIESPYKQLYESSQGELNEQEATNQSLSSMMSVFAATTLVFASAAAFLGFFVFARKARLAQPQP